MTNASRESGLLPRAREDRFESDDDLIAGMLAHEHGAWREFKRRFDVTILGCITKVTRRFSSILSQDDIREVYANLYVALLADDMHKLRSFDSERGVRLGAWIGLLTFNAAYDFLRSRRREGRTACITEAIHLAADVADPFELASDRERAAIAWRTLDEFSEKDRAFAVLYFADGQAPAVIAAKLNISVKTVYSKRHKLTARLESALMQVA